MLHGMAVEARAVTFVLSWGLCSGQPSIPSPQILCPLKLGLCGTTFQTARLTTAFTSVLNQLYWDTQRNHSNIVKLRIKQ